MKYWQKSCKCKGETERERENILASVLDFGGIVLTVPHEAETRNWCFEWLERFELPVRVLVVCSRAAAIQFINPSTTIMPKLPSPHPHCFRCRSDGSFPLCFPRSSCAFPPNPCTSGRVCVHDGFPYFARFAWHRLMYLGGLGGSAHTYTHIHLQETCYRCPIPEWIPAQHLRLHDRCREVWVLAVANKVNRSNDLIYFWHEPLPFSAPSHTRTQVRVAHGKTVCRGENRRKKNPSETAFTPRGLTIRFEIMHDMFVVRGRKRERRTGVNSI